MRLTSLDGFWFMPIPFGSIVKLSSLIQLPMDLVWYIPGEFFTSVWADDLSLESKFLLDSWTLLSILANLCNAVVWMVSICSPFPNFSSPFSSLFGTIPSAPITIGITITLMFYSFFFFFFFVPWQSLNICLFFRFLWFSLYGPQGRHYYFIHLRVFHTSVC